MKIKIKELFKIEKKPQKGLMAMEWVMFAYLLLTLLIIFFCYTKVQNPNAMIWGRVRIAVTTQLMWAVYRMLPCRMTRFLRVVVQMSLLSWWYPDTYEINRMLPNLDHVFAGWEQQLFGCQPALLFAEKCSNIVFSELMNLGYVSYFPLIVLVTVYYFLKQYADFSRCAFIIMASFFLYYVIFIMVPVTGPMFYYLAVGVDDIARGVFPDVGSYFNFHQEMLPTPGHTEGFFYQMVVDTHDAGERPTAAFPSSHVGITTVLMWLAWKTGSRRLLLWMLPFYVLLCLSTVYIMAHYVIDVIAGLVTGTLFFWMFYLPTKKMKDR